MNKLSVMIVSVFCLFAIMQCQAKTNISESDKSVIVLKDTVIDVKTNTEFEYLVSAGKWFIPHNADINITFMKDSTFVFNDFNLKTEEEEVLKGTFELNGSKLILKYNDRPQQTFNFKKGKGADSHYYITKGKNYYFVRSIIVDWYDEQK